MKKAILSLTSLILLALTISLPLRADSVRTTVAIGSSSVSVAANPATNKIYVAAESTGEVVVINGKTQQVTARIDIGRDEHNVAVNVFTNRIYATSCDSATALCSIAVIDGKTDTLITTIPVSSDTAIGLQGLAVNPVTNLIYASDAALPNNVTFPAISWAEI
jgi:YVTN family beta-propeller protein